MAPRAAVLLAMPAVALSTGTPYEILRCQAGEPALATQSLTTCEYQEALNAVKGAWESLSTECTPAECQQAAWAGCVLRMAGHDFMDFEPGSGGGSDGCTNMDAADNAGLSTCLHEGLHGVSLQGIYQQFCTKISLADFFVIAAEAVMEAARTLVPGVQPLDFARTFKYGRTTAKTCPEAGHSLPDAEGACDEVERVFVTNMGLDWRGVTALSGTHTLGRASLENSSYNAWWSDPENMRKFNNDYYYTMLMRGWMPDKAVGGNPEKNQWRRSDLKAPDHTEILDARQLMLNTDMCLAYDSTVTGFKINASSQSCCAWTLNRSLSGIPGEYCGQSDNVEDGDQQERDCCDGELGDECGSDSGKDARAFEHVKEFAAKDSAWIEAFMHAWDKATTNGFSNLQSLQSCEDEDDGAKQGKDGGVEDDVVGSIDAIVDVVNDMKSELADMKKKLDNGISGSGREASGSGDDSGSGSGQKSGQKSGQGSGHDSGSGSGSGSGSSSGHGGGHGGGDGSCDGSGCGSGYGSGYGGGHGGFGSRLWANLHVFVGAPSLSSLPPMGLAIAAVPAALMGLLLAAWKVRRGRQVGANSAEPRSYTPMPVNQEAGSMEQVMMQA
mmetsp:Transcript_88774/g.230380  ORF Transcript_88774/g.230380 Transcript_88774/m.230380 type:complete len:611 (-) Transcript_88774:144-1976(-)